MLTARHHHDSLAARSSVHHPLLLVDKAALSLAAPAARSTLTSGPFGCIHTSQHALASMLSENTAPAITAFSKARRSSPARACRSMMLMTAHRRHRTHPSLTPRDPYLPRMPQCKKRTVQACAGVSLPPNHTTCSNLTTPAYPVLLTLGLKEGHSGLLDGAVDR